MKAADLLDFKPETPITEAGLRMNINVGIHYLGAWLAGNGCVPIHNLMEDAATAEISRSPGLAVDPLAQGRARRRPQGHRRDGAQLMPEELAKIKAGGFVGKFDRAAAIFTEMSTQDAFAEFLTLPLYEEL